jgi:hypothetical protein
MRSTKDAYGHSTASISARAVDVRLTGEDDPSGSVATPRQTRQSQANRRREQGARHGPLLDSTVPAPPLTIKVGPLFRLRGRQPFADPAVNLLLEDGQRQGAVQEDGVVEVA